MVKDRRDNGARPPQQRNQRSGETVFCVASFWHSLEESMSWTKFGSMRLRRSLGRGVIALGSVFFAAAVDGQVFVVDQSATPEGPDNVFVLLSGGVGQEFKPAFAELDFIDVWLGSMQPNDTGTFQARVHENSIGGNILGVSDALTITAPSSGAVQARFLFGNSVPLSPGATYVFEIPHSGPFWGAALGPSTYEGGSFIQVSGGGWPEGYDLRFQEGVVVPEPNGWKLSVVGLFVIWFLQKRKR